MFGSMQEVVRHCEQVQDTAAGCAGRRRQAQTIAGHGADAGIDVLASTLDRKWPRFWSLQSPQEAVNLCAVLSELVSMYFEDFSMLTIKIN